MLSTQNPLTPEDSLVFKSSVQYNGYHSILVASSGFWLSFGLCPLYPRLQTSALFSALAPERLSDKVWGLSASDWQPSSLHTSACCLIRENVSVILGNVIYRSFLALSVTRTDYGSRTFISLVVAWKIVQMLCFTAITALNILALFLNTCPPSPVNIIFYALCFIFVKCLSGTIKVSKAWRRLDWGFAAFSAFCRECMSWIVY